MASGAAGASLYLDPFWFHSENPAFRSGGRTGLDRRDTYGARVWGKRRRLSVDWTLARQTGRYVSRDVDAWAAFAVQNVALSDTGWKPRLGARIDIASGGGAGGNGTLRDFNQLYASSSYLGDRCFSARATCCSSRPESR